MSNITNISTASPGVLQGGTTQVLLVSDLAAAIAIDSQERDSDLGKSAQSRQRISRVGSEMILSASGTCATTDGKGATTFDLQDSAPIEAQRLTWDDSVVGTSRFALALRSQLKPMEQSLYQGAPDVLLTPHVSVLLAGIDKRNQVFAARIRIPGKWIIRGPFHSIKFSDPTVETIIASPRKFKVVVETRQSALETRASNICAGRDPLLLKYPKLWSLHQPEAMADDQALRGAASDLVQFVIDNDEHVGGPIDVMSVRVRQSRGQ